MEVLPSQSLWIGDPVFLAAGVAAGRFSLIIQNQARSLRPGFQCIQFLGAVGLNPEMINAQAGATGRYGEVHRRIIQHPLCVVGFDAGWLKREKPGIETNVPGQVVDM